MPSVQSANILLLWTDREHNNCSSFRGLAELKKQSKKKPLKLPEQPVAIIKHCSMCQGLLL